MTQKSCITCKEVKDIECFYKHPGMKDGRLNKCKECQKKSSSDSKKNNPERTREQGRKYARKQSTKDKYALLSKDPNYKLKRSIAGKRYRERYKKKTMARYIVAHAKRTGIIVPPDHCSCCMSKCNPHAHHSDYNKPLDVIWLCDRCHKDWHISNEAIV